MNRPRIICHMMTAVDGRIDCGMTAQLPGVDEYYATLDGLYAPTRVSGRHTAQLEMADKDAVFEAKDAQAYGQEGFSKKTDAAGYEVVVDTKGTLRWDSWGEDKKPLVIVTSQQVAKEYLDYLDGFNISWIVSGDGKIDLARACAILADDFGVARMAVVGGGTINAGFLDAGLLDEVSVLIAPGIDGRGGMTAAFDGLPMDCTPFMLSLVESRVFEDGAVFLRYRVKNER